jgi:S1-C subfamily serine protease
MNVGDEIEVELREGVWVPARVVGYDDAVICVAYQSVDDSDNRVWELAWVRQDAPRRAVGGPERRKRAR